MKTRLMVVLCLVFFFSQAAFSQVGKNMVLASIVPTNTMYGRTVNFSNEAPIADVWGWTYNGVNMPCSAWRAKM